MNKILIINSGSSTLKFKVFSLTNLSEDINGMVERIGLKDSFMSISGLAKDDFIKKYPQSVKNHAQALSEVLGQIKDILPDIKLVGHRVVHGGGVYNNPTLLNSTVIKKIAKYNKLAPLHNPINLMCATAALKLLPKAKHMAVFDTAYYASIPEYVHRYALPEKFYKLGIRRYGFHGLSHQYSAVEGAKKTKLNINKSKIITCHLGSGCSITATKYGRAIDTTMGFTPLEGLTMSTRAGDLDASIPLYMIDELKMSTTEIAEIFNHKSGLLAIAGTMDMREILSAGGYKVLDYKTTKVFTSEQKIRAKLALDIFVYDIVRYIGQMMASMDGVDLIVMTGGIGERSPVVRDMVLNKIKQIARFKSITIPANEELMMAREIIK